MRFLLLQMCTETLLTRFLKIPIHDWNVPWTEVGLVCAMTKLDCSELAKNEIAHAKKSLTSEEFASLRKLLMSDKTLPDELLSEV